jgi:hypothetical protein
MMNLVEVEREALIKKEERKERKEKREKKEEK